MRELDAQRFERLILPCLDEAYTLARYLLRNEHDAQDIVQDAVLRAFRYFASFDGRDARAWLLSIVRNCCYTSVQERRAEGEPESNLAAPDATDERAMRASERERIQRAVESLPEELREVIVLRELQELSYREISDVTGAPMGTVMSRLSRARARLAALLGDKQEAV